MSTNINDFFKGLSERMYKENDLSDITYAMCVANSSFRQFFLDFFFRREFRLEGHDVEFTREWDDGHGNRPDFLIEDKSLGKFYIEVKVWDKNQHFPQYLESIKDHHKEDDNFHMSDQDAARHIGYIAAYKITQREYPECSDFEVRTWGDLHDELKLYVKNGENLELNLAGLLLVMVVV